MSQNKSAFFDFFFKFIIGIYCCNLGITIVQCFFVDISLHFFKQILNVCFNAFTGNCFFFQCITAHHFHSVVFKIAATHNQTNRYTLQFIISEFEARAFVICIIIFHRDTQCFQLSYNAFYFSVNLFQLFVILIDRNDYYLNRSQMWR